MVAFNLRPHQSRAITDMNGFLAANPTLDPLVIQPTGSGKSVVLAEQARLCAKAGKRVMVAAHRKELLSQNRSKLESMDSSIDAGFYSAGLNEKRFDAQVTFAGVQSAARQWDQFGVIDLVMIDECHLISSDSEGQYGQLLNGLKKINPNLRKIGLTATGYRLDSGKIYGPDAPFDAICHTTTINELLAAGYICPLVNRAVRVVDTQGIKKSGNDFDKKELANVFASAVVPACQETVAVANSEDRKKCMVFAVSIDHAKEIVDTITNLTGEAVGMVSSKDCIISSNDLTAMAADSTREQTLHDFVWGDLRWLVSVDTLHTGFDCPAVDLISCMRATLSPGLFYQLAGRGFRIHPGKQDCALLDFGGNIRRHGSLDDPDYGVDKTKSQGGGEAPRKQCPACETWTYAGIAICDNCGFDFPMNENSNLEAKADVDAVVLQGHVDEKSPARPKDAVRRFRVESATWGKNTGKRDPETNVRKNDTVRVEYRVMDEETGVDTRIKMYYCFDHDEGSWPQKNAAKFWKQLSNNLCPATVQEALELHSMGATGEVVRIEAKPRGEFWDVKKYIVERKPPIVVFDPEERWEQLCMFDKKSSHYDEEQF